MAFLNHNPFLRILFPFVCGITAWLCGFRDTPQLTSVIGVFSICIGVFMLMMKKAGLIQKLFFGWAAQIFLFVCGWFGCHLHDERQVPLHYTKYLAQEPSWYSGYIHELPAQRAKTIKVEVSLQQVKVDGEWKKANGKIIVYLEKTDEAHSLASGNVIVFKGPLREIPAPLNPDEFDYRNYLALKNIHHSAYLKTGSWTTHASLNETSLYILAQQVRQYLLSVYRESGLGDHEFAMVAALVLGYDDEIDQPLMNAYSHTGTLHVLSVSGLHVGVIYLLLGYMLGFLDKKKNLTWLKVFLILFFLWFFVLLSGFSAPAVRAALMFSLILIGKTLFQHVETTNIVFVSAFLSLLYNPYWLADVGFQLSYTAVLGIIFLYPRIYQMLTFSSGFMEKVWALCSVSIAAQIATLPLTLYYFHQFPVLFLVTNMIMIPVSTIVMYGGMLILAFSKIAIISKALVGLTGFLINFMNASALFFDSFPFCVIGGIHVSLLSVFLLYALIIILVAMIEKRSYRLLLSGISLICVMLVISIVSAVEHRFDHNLTIYHSSPASVLGVTNGTSQIIITDTIPDARFCTTLSEHAIQQDIVRNDTILLPQNALIIAQNHRILFAKNASSLNPQLIRACNADLLWLPSTAVKRKKQRKYLLGLENLVISGKIYKVPSELSATWITQKQGAFSLSLQ